MQQQGVVGIIFPCSQCGEYENILVSVTLGPKIFLSSGIITEKTVVDIIYN